MTIIKEDVWREEVIHANPGAVSREAWKEATDWAAGRKSHWNGMMEQEARDGLGVPDGARQQTIIATAQADAAEVVKWSALAVAAAQLEQIQAAKLDPLATPGANPTFVPPGTIASRPSDPVEGTVMFRTDLPVPGDPVYAKTSWVDVFENGKWKTLQFAAIGEH